MSTRILTLRHQGVRYQLKATIRDGHYHLSGTRQSDGGDRGDLPEISGRVEHHHPRLRLRIGDEVLRGGALATPRGIWVSLEGRSAFLEFSGHEGGQAEAGPTELAIRAPMTGQVLSVSVEPGGEVQTGDLLVILEAMKMEYRVSSPADAVVESVLVEQGASVEVEDLLVQLRQASDGEAPS